MEIRAALFTFACLIMIAPAGPTSAAADASYPVWWSPKLELQSLDQVDQRLRRDLWPEIGKGFELYLRGNSRSRKAYARDCSTMISLSEAGYWGLGNINIKPQIFNLAHCRAIALLAQANPVRTSYLRDFTLNAEALDYLPALVNLYPSCEFICYAVEANEHGIPFTKFETPLVVEVTSDDEMTVWTTGWMVILTIVGRGDFTEDGVDDMLLLANGGATEGTYGTTRLYLVTRNEAEAVLRVIDAEQELCPDYDCHPLPRDIRWCRKVGGESESWRKLLVVKP